MKKWIAIGCGGALLLLVGLGFGIYYGLTHLMKSSDAYQQSLAFAQSHPHVQNDLGSNIRQEGFPSGNWRTSGDTGEASLSFNLQGERGEGRIFVRSEKDMRGWHVRAAQWQFAGNTVDLALANIGGANNRVDEVLLNSGAPGIPPPAPPATVVNPEPLKPAPPSALPNNELAVVESPFEVRGALSKEVVRRVIRRHMNQVEFCYEQELRREPNLAGIINVEFVIDQDGAVSDPTVRSSSMNNVQVENCIATSIGRWTFPSPEAGEVTVNYPFVFRSE